MLCRRFGDSLAEYVDATLSAGKREAPERYFAGCAACHEDLRRRHQIGQAMRRTLTATSTSWPSDSFASGGQNHHAVVDFPFVAHTEA